MIKVLASIALALLIVILILVLSVAMRIHRAVKDAGAKLNGSQKALNGYLEENLDKSLDRALRSFVDDNFKVSRYRRVGTVFKKEDLKKESEEESSNGLKVIEKELKKEIDDVF